MTSNALTEILIATRWNRWDSPAFLRFDEVSIEEWTAVRLDPLREMFYWAIVSQGFFSEEAVTVIDFEALLSEFSVPSQVFGPEDDPEFGLTDNEDDL